MYRSFLTILVQAAVLCVATGTALSSSRVVATDTVPPPPVREEFFSPARDYVFALSTPDHWKSSKSVGELFQVAGNTRNLLWTRPLPHEFRPRYVLVGSTGHVLLLDEWINVSSRYAVMILDRDSQLVAQYDFDSVQRVLGVPVSKVTEMARHGWWIMSPPTLEPSGERARVGAAGKVLTIRLSDGDLSLAQ